MNKILNVLFILLACTMFSSCGDDNDEPISTSIEGRWIVTKWSDGSKLVTPDRVVSWNFQSDGTAKCGGETMNYSLKGNKLNVGSTTYTIKFINSYTMEWTGGYGHYKHAQLTRN